MIKADVLYIGYPRSGSTFLRAYFKNHPQINYDDQQIAELLYQPAYTPHLIDKPSRKVYVSCDESIAESVCITGRSEVWSNYLYRPGCFNLVRHDLVIDPKEAALRLKKWHPHARVMVVIREQVDWFSSLYKATVSQLPPNQRSFHDYWLTPQGIAMRLAAHHDIVLKAWMRHYPDMLIIRYEELMAPRTSWQLCRWLGVDHIPFAPRRVNESHAGLLRLHRALPFLSGLPHGIKSALKPLVKFVPGKRRAVLSAADEAMIRELYQESNARTASMLEGARAACLA